MVVTRRRRSSFSLFFPVIVFLAASIFSFTARGSDALRSDQVLDEQEMLIVEVRLEQYTLAQGIFIYHQPDYTLLPLDELMLALDFPIQSDADQGIADGWFLQESNTFNADFTEGIVYIRGQPQRINEHARIFNDGFSLFVDLALIEQWFDLDLTLDLPQLRLSVNSRATLPIIARLEREAGRTSIPSWGRADKDYPVEVDTYQKMGTPIISSEISAQNASDESGIGFRFQGSGDLLYHESRYSLVKASARNPESFRFSMHRKPISPTHPLPMGITEYSFGDIVSYGDRLVRNAASGVGVSLVRGQNNVFSGSFGEKNIEGDAPPGWEVELYANDLLVDFRRVGADGRYLFENIPVQFGQNVFDVRIYGPQGQVRSQRETLRVGDAMVQAQSFIYRLSLIRDGDQIITTQAAGQASNDASAELVYGLLENHSINLGMSRVTPSGEPRAHEYFSLGLLSAWSGFSTELTYANDQQSGRAFNVLSYSRLWGQDLRLEWSQYSDFVSEKNIGALINRELGLTLVGYKPIEKIGTLNYSWGFDEIKRRNATEYRVNNRLGLSILGFRVSNELTARYVTDSTSEQMDGYFNVDYLKHSYQVRTGLEYQLRPDTDARFFRFTYDLRKFRNYSFQLNTEFGLQPNLNDEWGVSIAKHLPVYTLSLDARNNSGGVSEVEVSILFGFEVEKTQPHLRLLNESETQGGRLQAKVFLDKDQDQKFSDKDTPLAGVEFRGRGHWRDQTTDENGEVRLTGLSTYDPTLVRVHEMSLEDPYWKPYQSERYVYSHEGANNQLWVPITITTEIEGEVVIYKGERIKPGSGIKLHLVDKDGVVVSRAVSEFDGFYFFTSVPPGEYWINVNLEHLDTDRFELNTPISVTTDPESGIVHAPEISIIYRN